MRRSLNWPEWIRNRAVHMRPAKVFVIAPPAPKCFETRTQWVEYLASAQGSGKTKPFKREQYQTNFNFCLDCTQIKAHEMTRQSRCDFKAHQQRARQWIESQSQRQSLAMTEGHAGSAGTCSATAFVPRPSEAPSSSPAGTGSPCETCSTGAPTSPHCLVEAAGTN